MYKISKIIVPLLLFASSVVKAEGWCDLEPGWQLITNGNKSDATFILGKFETAPGSIWISIADANEGTSNISMALAAQMSGKRLSIFLDLPSDTCQSFPSWAPMGRIRHIRIIE